MRLARDIRNQKFEETIVAAQISENAILDTPFLASQICQMSFEETVLTTKDKELLCTDRLGRPLMSKVHLIKEIS